MRTSFCSSYIDETPEEVVESNSEYIKEFIRQQSAHLTLWEVGFLNGVLAEREINGKEDDVVRACGSCNKEER